VHQVVELRAMGLIMWRIVDFLNRRNIGGSIAVYLSALLPKLDNGEPEFVRGFILRQERRNCPHI
jgi:hypothetical protein